MDFLKQGLFCTKCLTVLFPLYLVFISPVVKGQCNLPSAIVNSEYMWWVETDEFKQELVMTFTNSQTCKRYVNNNAATPLDFTAKSCEECASSTAAANNGVRYVGEQVVQNNPNMRLIICNELFPSSNGNVMIHRDDLRDQRPPGSITADQCLIETAAAKWLIRNQPGDLSLKQTETCPFRDGSYRMNYGFNGNLRCLGASTNTIATVRIAGSQMTFDASGCVDYINDRTARSYPTTDSTKIYGLNLVTTLSCATGSEFPGDVLGRSDAGNLLLLADLDPPANQNLKRPWYYAANYAIIGDEIQISIATEQPERYEVKIDPAQAPTRLNTAIPSTVMYLTLIRQTLTPSCNYPSSFERTWFVQYTTSGADTLEIMYDDTQNSEIERRIYKSNTARSEIISDPFICSNQQTSSVGSGGTSGTYYFYAIGDVGELTCYAYMAPNSAITDKVLVRYESNKGMFQVANDDTCREYMNSPYNPNTEANKRIVLRVQPRVWLDNFANGVFGVDKLFGNWNDNYKCPFGEGSFQLVYSESETITNQCSGDSSSYATVSGNALTIKSCSSANTYQQPYNRILTCITGWNAEATPHLPPGQGEADQFTSDHYVVLAYNDLNVGSGIMRFYCARYRVEDGGDTVKIALNVDSEIQTLCRTDLNAEARVKSNTGGGNIRQFTLTKFPNDICDASPCFNDGTCKAGSNGEFTCQCHGSYSGGLCEFRTESFSESSVTTTITIIVIVCLVLVAIVILAVILRERQVRKDEKKRMDSEYGQAEGHKPDNISTISQNEPKSNASLSGSNVQAWFPDYRQNGQ